MTSTYKKKFYPYLQLLWSHTLFPTHPIFQDVKLLVTQTLISPKQLVLQS